jgi:hypothetical protein
MIAQGGNRAVSGVLNIIFTIFVMSCVACLLLLAVARWLVILRGPQPPDSGGTVSTRPESLQA